MIWLLVVLLALNLVLTFTIGKIIMTKLDDLGTAIAALGVAEQAITDGLTNFKAVQASEDAEIQAAIAAITAGGTATDPQVQALIDAVTAQQTNLTAAAQTIATAATDATTQTAAIAAAIPASPAPPAAPQGAMSAARRGIG